MKTIFRISHDVWSPDCLSLRMATISPDGRVGIPESLKFTLVEPDHVVRQDEPLVTMDHTAAVMLMDELWRAGIRPTEVGGAGHLKATERHLEDMRRLVFKDKYQPIKP